MIFCCYCDEDFTIINKVILNWFTTSTFEFRTMRLNEKMWNKNPDAFGHKKSSNPTHLDVLGQNIHGQISKSTHFLKASQMQENIFICGEGRGGKVKLEGKYEYSRALII